MAESKRNFLLGRGENLTVPIPAPGRTLEREAPYTIEEAKARLQPMLSAAVMSFQSLPPSACPHDEAVASIVLNPEYIAKSYYPEALFKAFDLRAVGSHSTRVKPEQRSKGRTPAEKLTTELFVAGTRKNFKRMLDTVPTVTSEAVANALPAVELLSNVPVRNKIKPIDAPNEEVTLEVVLHASEQQSNHYILEGFREYARSLGLKVDLDRRLHAGSLCFVSLRSPKNLIEDLAEFSFLRVVRQMPKLRLFEPTLRGVNVGLGKAKLPSEAALDPNIRVAVFDGGLPEKSAISKWVTLHEPKGIGPSRPEYLEHGQQVTSALLFGPLDPDTAVPRPYAAVDHYRVLDETSESDRELHEVLRRIKDVLVTNPKYDFINLSLGPHLPVEDDDVHAWTAALDEYLADGLTVATVAVGNNGAGDAAEGLNRVQVPSDSVNALAVGACDRTGHDWQRAGYSAVGPGRSPGLIKPSLLAFGGSPKQLFLTVSENREIIGVLGTSFAAPYTLRSGIAARAHFGNNLSALAVQALLVHGSEAGDHPREEIGWGRLAANLEDLVVCPPGMIRVVYQGELTASKYIRAGIPLPAGDLEGKVTITATCCFCTDVDPAHASNYTRSGVEITFRPHSERFKDEAVHPKTKSFFSGAKLFAAEDELRNDAHKWETCLHHSQTMLAKTLKNPVFDIHYMARDEGRVDSQAGKMKYALIVSVHAKRHADLYDRVVRDFRNYLEPMVPLIEVPVTVSTGKK